MTNLDPSCRDNNKHKACTGSAWDEDADELVACECLCHGEQMPTQGVVQTTVETPLDGGIRLT